MSEQGKVFKAFERVSLFVLCLVAVFCVGLIVLVCRYEYLKHEPYEVKPTSSKVTYVFLKQGCQQKLISKEESQIWGTYAQDKKWVFLVPQVCEGTYALMSSEGAKITATVSFVDGGTIIELNELRIGIK